MSIFFALMILYVSSEIGMASWLVTYLQRIHAQDVRLSAAFLSIYFGGLMVGRLLGTLFVERVGYMRSIFIVSLCATLCVAIGLFGPGPSYWLLPLTGLFFSIVFPTLTAAATEGVTENLGTLMGLLFAFCGLGGALGPWLIGLVSDSAGIQAGFTVNLVTTALTTLGALWLLRTRK
jgi:fucose permease